MADLFASLSSATRALEAQRFALDATGQNIANVNTPGYTRRTVDFAAVPPESRFSAGRGVEVAGIRAQRDRLIERRLEQETTAAHREAAVADALVGVEVTLGPAGHAIDTRLTEFFDSFARLADSPMSPVARQEVALQGQSIAGAFRDTSERFRQARRDTNLQLDATLDDINELAARIAAINGTIGAAGRGTAGLHFDDQQTELVRELSTLTEIRVLQREGGGVDIDIADGRALVVGGTNYSLVGTATGPDGMTQVSLNGTDITSEITGGKAGGLLHVRDLHIPGYQARLDEQAYALAEAVNTIHAAGFDLNGNTGQDFFAFSAVLAGPAGAASALVVDPALAADTSRIAAGSVALPADNRTARALADVRDARVLDGGTATLGDGWSQLVYRVGRDVQTARSESTMRNEIVLQVETLRDQVSGVSLDEEAMHLMKFQRAYEANARFFRVVDQTLDTLLNALVR